MNLGINELKTQLTELKIDTEILNNQYLIFKYIVPHGRFKEQEIEIALEAPQFPMNPPSGLYIRPHLMPNTGGGGVHPNGGIHDWKKPDPSWQYWSRPFSNWNNSSKDAKTYLSFIRTIFDFS